MKADNVNGITRYITAALLDRKFRMLLGWGYFLSFTLESFLDL